jgi:hypothetical protein
MFNSVCHIAAINMQHLQSNQTGNSIPAFTQMEQRAQLWSRPSTYIPINVLRLPAVFPGTGNENRVDIVAASWKELLPESYRVTVPSSKFPRNTARPGLQGIY